MTKPKDNREYYEVFDFSPSKMEKRVRYEVLYSIGVVVFLISLMVLPIVLTNLVRAWMRSLEVDGGTATVVLCAVCLGSYAAVCTEEEHFEQDRLSYIYNLLNAEYDLHGEDITLYKITPETFASHYTFHKIVPRRDMLCSHYY